MTRISVLGAGSWGTAFSLVLADAGNDVTIWGRRPEVCESINERHENVDGSTATRLIFTEGPI